MTQILEKLALEPLKERRKQSRLTLFCKDINHQATFPTHLLQNLARQTKNRHTMPFRQVTAITAIYKESLMPKKIKDWKSVPSTIINKISTAADPIKSFAEVVRRGAKSKKFRLFTPALM